MGRPSNKTAEKESGIGEGEAVLGMYDGYQYPGKVERVFGSTRLSGQTGTREQTALYLVHWQGYKGKKALSVLRKCEVQRRRDGGTATVQKGEELAVTVTVPSEIFDKNEFKLMYELFELPEKLRTLLVDQEEEIVELQIPSAGRMTVRECLDTWVEERREFPDTTKEEGFVFAKWLENLFDQKSGNILYAYEIPYIQEVCSSRAGEYSQRAPVSERLGAVYLVRLLSMFPEIFAAIAREVHVTTPNKKTVEGLESILLHSRLFFSLAEFLVANYVRILSDDEKDRPTGLYYLSEAPSDAHMDTEQTSVNKAESQQTWKRKKPNYLVRSM